MAAREDFGPAVVNVPHTFEVAKPPQAPNYVGMFSEAIRGALQPYEYLLNYRKELSEEDARKAQIQNYLAEHDLKTKELQETIRTHTADEAQKRLDFQIAQARETELNRHNVADELHQTHLEAIDQAKAEAEEKRASIEEQVKAIEADRLKLQDKESASKIAENQAVGAWHQSEAEKNKRIAQDEVRDQGLVDQLRDYIHGINDKDLYNSDKFPDIQKRIIDLRSQMRTKFAQAQADELIGTTTGYGRESQARESLLGMAPEARAAFQDELRKPGPQGEHPADQFYRAMHAAEVANNQVSEMSKWGPEATQAHNAAITAGKTPAEAFLVGRGVQASVGSELKKPAAFNQKLFEDIRDAIPKKEGEDESVYESRQNQEALEKYKRWFPEQFDTQGNILPGAVPAGPAGGADTQSNFLNKFFQPKSGLKPGENIPGTGGAVVAPPEKPVSMAAPTTGGGTLVPGPGSAFALTNATSPLMPGLASGAYAGEKEEGGGRWSDLENYLAQQQLG